MAVDIAVSTKWLASTTPAGGFVFVKIGVCPRMQEWVGQQSVVVDSWNLACFISKQAKRKRQRTTNNKEIKRPSSLCRIAHLDRTVVVVFLVARAAIIFAESLVLA